MKNIFWLTLCWCMISCGVDSTEIGADFFRDGRLDISMIDSSTVSLSTVMMDNIISNNKDRIIVGNYSDAALGSISGIAFLQFQINSAVTLPTSDVDYESLQLVFVNDGYSFYDTANILKLKIHRITEALEPDASGNLHTSDSFDYDDDVLASAQFYPRPNRTEEYEFPLSDALGHSIFSKAQESHSDLSNNTEFTEFLKGLVLVPDLGQSSALLGLGAGIELRLYYRDRTVVPTEQKYLSFALNMGTSFTRFDIDRGTSTVAALVKTSEKLNASETDDEAYIQGGTALALRVDLPYLRNFRQHPNFYLTKAVLEFSPVRKSYNEMNPLPSGLFAFRVDETNEVYSSEPFSAGLVTDYSLSRDTFYEVDVTAFVKEQMDMVALNENGLVFISGETEINGDRMCFATPSNEYNTKLKIYYATINE